MVDQAEIAMNYISQVGPVLPVQIAKKLETEILFAGAILSDLVSRKKLKTSKKPIGGSPVYYIPGQENLLEKKLYHVLKQREREAYDLLKEKGIVWERELEPWQRVALNDLKDFAVPMRAMVGADTFTNFWRFHLVSDIEANEKVKETISKISIPPKQVEELKPEIKIPDKPIKAPEVEPTVQKIEKTQIKEIEEPSKKEEFSKQTYDDLKAQLLSELKNKIPRQETQGKIMPKPEPQLTGKFYQKVSSYFQNKDFNVISKDLIKKEKEFDFIVSLPSSIGNLRYYVKTIDKAKLNEKDLSLAMAEGNARKLPTLYISPGELSKKGKEFLAKHQDNIVFKKI